MLATVLAVCFYVGAIALTVWLARTYIGEWQNPDGKPWKIRHIGYAVCALIIPWSLWPRKNRFKAPGPRLEPAAHPVLFEMVRGVAEATRQPMPTAIYLVPECNAWVSEVELDGNVGRQRIMAIGLPLFVMLPQQAVRAIIAHEFGHYHGGDTHHANRFYRIDDMARTTLNRVRHIHGLVAFPFLVYLMVFRAITGRLSRLQEFAADRLAASVAGADSLGRGLIDLAGRAEVCDDYWRFDVAVALRAGCQLPIIDGLVRTCRSDETLKQARGRIETELEIRRARPNDTHPPLKQRLGALGVDAASLTLDNDDGCLDLLGPLAPVEHALAAHYATGELRALEWSQLGTEVSLPVAMESVARGGKALRGMRARHFATHARAMRRLARSWVRFDEFRAGNLLASAIVVALHERGWQIEARPGDTTRLTRGSVSVAPFDTMFACIARIAPPDAWIQLMRESEVERTDFGALYERCRIWWVAKESEKTPGEH